MNEEDKDLLLKDLCARLPYGVKTIHTCNNYKMTIRGIDVPGKTADIIEDGGQHRFVAVPIEDIKPYLRRMDSMTEEETAEYTELFEGMPFCPDPVALIDWLNAHHFDYNWLIDHDLAVEVTEENNPYK